MLFELEIRVAQDACHDIEIPQSFVLVGRGGPNIVECGDGQAPFVIDAEGVVLQSGAVYAWCRTGCCAQLPQRWSSVDAIADYHASLIIDQGGIRSPDV